PYPEAQSERRGSEEKDRFLDTRGIRTAAAYLSGVFPDALPLHLPLGADGLTARRSIGLTVGRPRLSQPFYRGPAHPVRWQAHRAEERQRPACGSVLAPAGHAQGIIARTQERDLTAGLG